MTYRRHALIVSIGLAGALALGACAKIDNDRVTVGGEVLPAHQTADTRAQTRLVEAQGPSLAGVDRTNWATTSITVAGDGVQHAPTWRTEQPAYAHTPRTDGLHPTAQTALDLEAPSGVYIAEGVAAPFHAATDVVLLIPRMFSSPPSAVRVSPRAPYERSANYDRRVEVAAQPAPVPTVQEEGIEPAPGAPAPQ